MHIMRNDIYQKLTELRDKYPKDIQKKAVLKELIAVAFENGDVIPDGTFTINGFHNPNVVENVINELGITKHSSIIRRQNSTLSHCPTTEITLS